MNKEIHVSPEILRGDFKYAGVEYEYENTRCCCDESICRCSRIANARVTEVDINRITTRLFERTAERNDTLLRYCFHRILSHSRARNTDSWEVSTRSGYYGEEIGSVSLDHDTANNVIRSLEEVMEIKSDVKRIKYVLEFEYGYLLESLKGCKNCSVEKVSLDSISIPQQEHYRRLDKDIVDKYSGYDLPACVCLVDGDKFRLIDGYHRLRATNKRGAKKIEVVVLK